MGKNFYRIPESGSEAEEYGGKEEEEEEKKEEEACNEFELGY